MPRRATPPSAANDLVCASNSISCPWLGYATSQNAREAHSFRCATCAWWYTPPTTMPSSLQSNWNASPSSKLSGTNAFVVSLPESCRHVRMKSVTAL